MSAYVDLTLVLAGIVADPGSYASCGYAEAILGMGLAREGIRAVCEALHGGQRFNSGAGLGGVPGLILRDLGRLGRPFRAPPPVGSNPRALPWAGIDQAVGLPDVIRPLAFRM